ncbi:hypothetical protein [Nocardiopsis sp. YSL2]|uniref:hypothetical protein n=1 Tax=Nocardiopsis sp. YSL2 TaxID=2939492 RepID=UPI0026F44FE4|nr:hypothetical protein [Nocardiopsis sp. YSL2]
MIADERVSPGVRAVLSAPRGRRFTHTPQPSRRGPQPSREQRLLAQMRGNPRVERRMRQGELPPWMLVAEQRRRERERAARRRRLPVPAPRPAPDDGPPPPSERPPLPRRPRPRPRRHRRPRRPAWPLVAYTLAAAAGALARHLTTGLF